MKRFNFPRRPIFANLSWHSARPIAAVAAVAACLIAVGLRPGAAEAAESVTTTIEGGNLVVRGTGAADALTFKLKAGDPTTLRVDIGPSTRSFNVNTFTSVVVLAGGGDDAIKFDLANGTPPASTVDGEEGLDTITVEGSAVDESFTTTANGTRVRFDRLSPAPWFIDLGTVETLDVQGNGGADSSSATGNLAALVAMKVSGGPGNDTLLGSNGIDILNGDAGDDFVDGQQGNDIVKLGGGNDTFQWDPGDGSDAVDGQGNSDTLLFNGSNGAEIIEVAPNAGRTRFTRNLGNIVMDIDTFETLDIRAFGSADTVIVNHLGGTGISLVKVALGATAGGGDAQPDGIVAMGTNSANTVDIVGSGTSYQVTGLAARLEVTDSEGANDSFTLNANSGNDTITATNLPAGIVKLTIDGGIGNDKIFGSQGADTLLGGDGKDTVFGDNGADMAHLGIGDDTFQWDPGDGNDVIEGQEGIDALLFNGSEAAENVDIFANGGRTQLFRNVANVTQDMNDVETIDLKVFGSADNIVVGDLTGTDVTAINIDLGAGDTQPDMVTVNGTNGPDTFGAFGAATTTTFGLQATVKVTNGEAANDQLVLNALGGDDVVDATSLAATALRLTLNGGLGIDTLIGGAGNDTANGGDGDDRAFLGIGDDTFTWNPGDDNDTLEGQDGFDRMIFNGANAAEQIDIAASAGRARFFRNIANVVMDLNDMEAIDYNAFGGADLVVVNDLSGTDVVDVNANFALAGGASDGAVDSALVLGTNGDDVVFLAGDASGTSVLGLAARVTITGGDPATDLVNIGTFGGDDVIEGSAMLAGAVQFYADGGDDDDVLVGGEGNDVLSGGEGDDVLVGGPGLDALDGGPGDNTVIQD